MEKEFTFPLERSPPVKILGLLWTGKLFGQIIVGALLFIALFFMNNQKFSLISILFSVLFLFPMMLITHFRFVRKGKKLMEPSCEVIYHKDVENNIEKLEYKTGYPNTTNPNWQEVHITEEIRNMEIRGHELGGYHIRVTKSEEDDMDRKIRLGLWIDLEHAKEAANELASLINGSVTINIQKEEEDNDDVSVDLDEF